MGWRRGVLLVLLVGCSPEMAPPDPDPIPPDPTCPVGSQMVGYGCHPAPPSDCAPGTRADLTSGECISLGRAACPTDFELDASGWSCVPTVTRLDCPPGTSARIGETDCVAVGWNDCGRGFEPRTSGRGCQAIVAETCPAATRAAIGQAGCVAIGNCQSAFPPPGATIVGNDLQLAIDDAAEGAVLAIDAGTYAGPVIVNKTVSIVGQCAAEVIVTGTADGFAVSAPAVMIRGVTLRGHARGVRIEAGGEVQLDEVVIEGASDVAVSVAGHASLNNSLVDGGLAIRVEAGATLGVTGVEIKGSPANGIEVVGADARFEAEELVLRGAGLGGILVEERGSADIETSVIDACRFGSAIARSGGQIVVRQSALTNSSRADGVVAVTRGSIELTDVLIDGHLNAGLFAEGPGSSIRMQRSVSSGNRSPAGGFGGGALARAGANVTALDSAFARNHTFSAAAIGAELVIERSRLTPNASAFGVLAGQRATVSVNDTQLAGSFALQSEDRTIATATRVVLRDGTMAAVGGGTLQVVESAFIDAGDLGIFVHGADSHAKVSRTFFTGGRPIPPDPAGGHALSVAGDATALMEDSDVIDNANAGIAAIDGGTATIVRSVLRQNIRNNENKNGNGVVVNGAVTIRNSAIIDNEGIGIGVRSGTLVLEDSLVRNNQTAGVFAIGDTGVDIADSTIESQRATTDTNELGVGVLLGGRGTIVRTLVRDNTYAGVGFEASVSSMPVAATITSCLIEGTKADATGFGHGLIVGNDAVARITGSIFYDNESVGALFTNTSGAVDSSTIAENGIGTVVQLGSTLEQVEAWPSQIPSRSVMFTKTTRFFDNDTRIGSGEVPVPAIFEP